MRVIPPRISLAFAGPCQPLYGRNPLTGLPIGDAAAPIALGYRFQFALQACRRGLASFANGGVGDQAPIGERRQHVHSTVNAQRYAGRWERDYRTLAFETRIPAIDPARQPRAPEIRDSAAFAKASPRPRPGSGPDSVQHRNAVRGPRAGTPTAASVPHS